MKSTMWLTELRDWISTSPVEQPVDLLAPRGRTLAQAQGQIQAIQGIKLQRGYLARISLEQGSVVGEIGQTIVKRLDGYG